MTADVKLYDGSTFFSRTDQDKSSEIHEESMNGFLDMMQRHNNHFAGTSNITALN